MMRFANRHGPASGLAALLLLTIPACQEPDPYAGDLPSPEETFRYRDYERLNAAHAARAGLPPQAVQLLNACDYVIRSDIHEIRADESFDDALRRRLQESVTELEEIERLLGPLP
jgi:hypothetical protein